MPSAGDQTTSRIRNNWIILGSVNLAVPLVSLWNYHSGSSTRHVALISAAIVLVAGNAGLLLALPKQLKKEGIPSPPLFTPASVAFAIISFAVTAFGLSHLQNPDDYLRIALSDTPLSSIEPQRRRLIVELLRERAAYSRKYDKALKEASAHPLNPPLYSPESFANKAVMASTIANLTKFMNMDVHYSDQVQQSKQNFSEKMAAYDPAYLKSWDQSMQERDSTQAATMQAERDWFASVTSLYGYAETHASEITLKQGSLIFTSTSVRDSFNQQMSHSKDLQQKQTDLTTIEIKQQQQAKQNLIQ